MLSDVLKLDASAQAALLRGRSIAASELVEAAIKRAELLDPIVHAIAANVFDAARTAAQQYNSHRSSLAGVPFMMKDTGATQSGQPYYAGNRALKRIAFRAPQDTYLGARLRRIGLITLATTSTTEFGQYLHNGSGGDPTPRNPWSLSHSAGGSSGGSCAAVASGMVAVAHCSDAAGSIRLPAAWCGLVGLKPSRGRVSISDSWVMRAPCEFLVTRSVRDVAALLDALHGAMPGDLYVAPLPTRTFTECLNLDPGPLRIGVLSHHHELSVHCECRTTTEVAAAYLARNGHFVDYAWPPAIFDPARFHHLRTIRTVNIRRRVKWLSTVLDRRVCADDLDPQTVKLLSGPAISAEAYVAALEWEQQWSTKIATWWTRYDLLLTPTVVRPAVPLPDRTTIADANPPPLNLGRSTLLQPFNVTGQPAISVPLGVSADGLPVGVQLVARFGGEDQLIQIARSFEQSSLWLKCEPPTNRTFGGLPSP